MKHTEEQLEDMVETLQREVSKLQQLLQGQERYDFRYDNSEKTYWQRTAKANIMSGDGFTSWEQVDIDSSGGTTSYSDFSFGSELGTDLVTVTVQAGKIRHETRTAIAVSETEIVISGTTWIWVEYEVGSGVGSIKSGASEPVSNLTTVKWPLSYWTFASGVAVLSDGGIKHVGDINIPSIRGE